ncbi:Uu.00g052380.m01.CDS01 [Anthostomella pinea]|uniref:Uu.00g052380.m01.CDS01 n=1 Tax=Anthostomella pinea TaxID=933095 RepID=A0AAI8VXF7_9PEZI|nr:Uu.00g052380.m01.CDS01 [Anthostomella pinea]
MRFLETVWKTTTTVVSWLTFSPISPGDVSQSPLGFPDLVPSAAPPAATTVAPLDHPVFTPPSTPSNGEDSGFVCEYPEMTDWYDCSSPSNRECWLRHPDGRELNIHTDYEAVAPVGIQRNYTLVVNDGNVNLDGMNFTDAKLFNNTYPGPWLQACWGDVSSDFDLCFGDEWGKGLTRRQTVNVKVINNMKWNGTSIHWHGIRQNYTNPQDGVNGVTQCPIAPGDSFEYSWKAVQYGSTWYHSHYSVQYADGVQGPITIHGPTSAPFDEAPDVPLLMTDWGHDSAFASVYRPPGRSLLNASFLLNGKGNLTRLTGLPSPAVIPGAEELHFEQRNLSLPGQAKRYLLRLINTSFDTTFIFTIDNHWLQIVSADFVPLEPYYNTSVLIGIGQRYNVIVEARPEAGPDNPIPEDGNFWIRTFTANGCGEFQTDSFPGSERSGIIRYDDTSTAEPTSLPWNVSKHCSDETYTSLRPVVPWQVGAAANGENGQEFNVNFDGSAFKTPIFPLAVFALDPQGVGPGSNTPFQVNFSQPVFFEFNNTSGVWPKQWVIVPEDYTENDWVVLVIDGTGTQSIALAHPIHLHGHDFAVLQQAENKTYTGPADLDLQLRNPPRRDVVLLPASGFIVIAFKADNPGSWLMHCHIARHASEGLGLQILERQADADALWPQDSSPQVAEARRVCRNWDAWHDDCANWWPGVDPITGQNPSCGNPAHVFQDDSGI